MYASEGAYSKEISMLNSIERFGLEAITGRRQFNHDEFIRLMWAERIVMAFRSRMKASNLAEWAVSNPELAEVLLEAEKSCH